MFGVVVKGGAGAAVITALLKVLLITTRQM